MANGREPTPPEVTLVGGPGGGGTPPPARSRLGRTVLAAAALAVVAGAVLSQRQDEPAPPACPEPCLAPDSVVLGAALPLTGVLAPFGSAQRRGVERALAQAGADDGVVVGDERRQVELVVRDTRSEPDVAGQEALILVRGPFRLTALIGPCAPPVALVRVAQSRQVPLVSGCQPLPELGGGGPRRLTWEVAPAEAERAAAVFDALVASGRGRTGLFLSNDRAEEPWTSAATRAGVAVVGTYRPQGRDWAAAVAQAVADGVEVVVAVTQPPEGIGLWEELRAGGLAPRAAYASEAGLGSAWWTAVGPDADGTLTDLVHPSVSAPATPEQVDDAVAEVSSELTRVLLDGLRRARTAERSDLRAALTGAGGEVAGRPVRFGGDQASRLPPRLARWQDGRLVPLVR